MRTLRNAFATGRIAHAFMLTGVRGVGKTTTARIIARALNCIGPDGKGGPTAEPCGVCANCTAIAEDRHLDVIEMDAASRTGVDDIRELIEGVRYRPVPARYQDLHHRRSAHALEAGVQRAAEDAGGAAAAREVHLRHHRDPQGAGHGAVALPALRPAPRAAADARPRISAHRRARASTVDARRARADRARRRRLGARRALACSTRRSRRRGERGRRGRGARDARPRRSRPRVRSVRSGDEGRRRRCAGSHDASRYEPAPIR